MSKKTAVRWLDRRICAPGPHLCLCLSESAYLAAMQHIGISSPSAWISTIQANATAHHVASPKGLAVVVCMPEYRDRDPIEVAGLLVHEAVHAWQEWCNFYGESAPGREQEAYAVQSIAQELMADYARQIGARA